MSIGFLFSFMPNAFKLYRIITIFFLGQQRKAESFRRFVMFIYDFILINLDFSWNFIVKKKAVHFFWLDLFSEAISTMLL